MKKAFNVQQPTLHETGRLLFGDCSVVLSSLVSATPRSLVGLLTLMYDLRLRTELEKDSLTPSLALRMKTCVQNIQ